MGTNTTLNPAPDPCDAQLHGTMPTYVIAGKYLVTILTEEIHMNMTLEVFDKHDSTESIVKASCRQFAAYTCQELPFIYLAGVHAYWKKLIDNEDASVLAVGTSCCSSRL